MQTIKVWEIFILNSLHFILTQVIFLAYVKILIHSILWTSQACFWPMPKFYGPTPPTAFFWPTPKFYKPTPCHPRHPRTHATRALTLPTPPTLFSRLLQYQVYHVMNKYVHICYLFALVILWTLNRQTKIFYVH